MAKKVQLDDDKDDAEEIFTDLRGNPDPVEADALDQLDTPRRKKSKVQPDNEGEADPDFDDEDDADPLQMDADGDEEDAEPADEDEGDEPGAEADEPVIEEPQGEDPRDLALRQRTLDLLEERAQRLIEQEGIAKNAITVGEKAMLTATARLKTAKEAGDTDAEIAAMGDWTEARDSITKAKDALTMIERGRNVVRGDLDKIGFDAKSGRLMERTAAPAASTKLTANATKFLSVNSKWLKDPKHKAQADLLFAIDGALGADPKWKDKKNDPAYFAELGRRFNRDNPGMVRGVDGKLIASAQRQRGAGASTTGSVGVHRDASGNARGGKIKFEESDKRSMTKFGLDPTKRAHRAAWLREKSAVTTQSNGRA